MGEDQGGRPRIGVDGYNLALEQGTGVATYARNLTYALKDAGAAVDVLYGRNMPSSGGRRAERDLIQEIGFFDPAPGASISNVAAGAFWAMATLPTPRASASMEQATAATPHSKARSRNLTCTAAPSVT